MLRRGEPNGPDRTNGTNAGRLAGHRRPWDSDPNRGAGRWRGEGIPDFKMSKNGSELTDGLWGGVNALQNRCDLVQFSAN
jgi:hypothetical protein